MVGRRVPGSAAASANTARGSAISPAVRVDSEVFFNVIKRPPRSTCASMTASFRNSGQSRFSFSIP